jgi:hypothetical protein
MSEQMTNGKTKERMEGGKIYIQNTIHKRLNTDRRNTYGRIKKYIYISPKGQPPWWKC